ncbi:MAG: hypothetical protein QNJ00_04725 [Woeseiaceae bacterium]|nr:hypothetical protein [Woeseiaceae bacterium]
MQHTIHALFQLVFITSIAIASSAAALLITGRSSPDAATSAWAVGAVALAGFTVQTVAGKLTLSTYALRWLLDPRAAAEGLWIERTATPGCNGGVTYSLLSIEYNAVDNSYVIHIWNFDEHGRELRWLFSTQIDFGIGNKRVLYRYQGHRLVRCAGANATDSDPLGAYAQECHGFGWLVFCGSRFGKYSFARGEFIDCSLRASIDNGDVVNRPAQMRSIVLRRVRKREIHRILNEDVSMRDPEHRMRGRFSTGRYSGTYKNHDLARVALAFRRAAMCQDRDLEAKSQDHDCDSDAR